MKKDVIQKTTCELLTIPDFLRRKRRSKLAKVKPYLSNVHDYSDWDKIKQQKFGTRYDIMLNDDAPRIGSGSRTVYVKEGRKWATMIYHSGNPNDKQNRVVRKKFRLKVWYEIKSAHERFEKRNDPIEVMKRHNRKLRKTKIKGN